MPLPRRKSGCYSGGPTGSRASRDATLSLSPQQNAMKHLIPTILGILFFMDAHAAMVRVVDVRDGRTFVIERNGNHETIQLAGIAVTDDDRAAELLRWSLVSTWVMLEPHPRGGHLAYRSPDALFVNRELVLRGFARATEHGIEPERNLVVTYLGIIDPPATPRLATPPAPQPQQTQRTVRPRRARAPRKR